jgi:hypothetical protein
MENKKTVAYLNSKVWYRTLKILYILSLIFIFIKSSSSGYTCIGYRETPCDYWFWFKNMLIDLLILGIAFETIRRIFYYIILGTIRPKK